MTKFYDINTLGLRKVKYQETGQIVDPKTGMKQLGLINKVRDEAQPILTADEAAVIADADWREAPSGSPCKYMCIVSNRRFFTDGMPEKTVPVTGDEVSLQEKAAIKRAETKLAEGKKLTEFEMKTLEKYEIKE